MKQFLNLTILLLLSASLFISCTKKSNPAEPIVPDDTTATYTPSDSARTHFLLDATDFAVDYLFETQHTDTSKVIVPINIVNQYLFPLARLYDARNEISLLDTLIIQKRVLKYEVSSYGVILRVDTICDWVQNLMHGVTPTGNFIIDSLSNLYDLQFESFAPWGNLIYFKTIQTPMNNYALSNALRAVPEILFAVPNYCIRTQTKLEIVPSATSTIVHFYYGYGDCPSGCSGYERWSFSVSTDYKVTYLGYLLQ